MYKIIAPLVLLATFSAAQFSTNSTQPLCATTYTMNCTNFSPQDGSIILGWNVDFDRHDTISAMLSRMSAAGTPGFATTPGAYGIFIKIGASGLIGQTPNDARKEDLDTMLEQMKGTNAILVASLDPTEGYEAVTDAGLQLFADKMAEFNRFGIPALIRPAHEMNGPWYEYGQQPQKFKDFYRKTYAIVKAKAPFTKFIFAPNLGNGYPWSGIPPKTPLTAADIAQADTNNNGRIDIGDDPYEPYWPGADVVDWFGLSMYFKGTYPYNINEVAPTNYIQQQMGAVLGGGVSTYEYARLRNLPIVFPEMAGSYCATNPGVANLQTKQNFWEEAFGPALRTAMPLIKMGLWFDYSKAEDGAQRDFSISNRNETIPNLGSITEVAPVFKQNIATYGSLLYASNLNLSDTGACGCFKYNAQGAAISGVVTTTTLGAAATTTVGRSAATTEAVVPSTSPTGVRSGSSGLKAGGMVIVFAVFFASLFY